MAVDVGVRVEVLFGLLCDVDGVLALVVCGHDGGCVVGCLWSGTCWVVIVNDQ